MEVIRKMNQNMKAFLDMIAFSEIGQKLLAMSDNGYNVIVGSTPQKPILFHSYADHPRKLIKITDKLYSTAAGRYQILQGIFDFYKHQLRLPDFTPASQDKIAIQLIRECRALGDIDAGRFDVAVKKCKSRWASLPGAGYAQHENKMADLRLAFQQAGGIISNMA